VAALAVEATDIFNGNAFALAVLNLIVVALVSLVIIIFGEFDLGLAVAIDTPAHTKGAVLIYQLHLLNGSVTILTLQVTNGNVLGVVEVSVVG
jgi:hypothetical protein